MSLLSTLRSWLPCERCAQAGKTMIVSYDAEYDFTTGVPQIRGEDVELLKGIVNSQSYGALRRFLLDQALTFYRDARQTKDANVCVVINSIGRAFEEFIAKLDTLKIRPEAEVPNDPYEP